MKRCVIVGAGKMNDYEKISAMINDDDYIISADGGIRHLNKMKIEPDLLLGDFDSSNKPESGNILVYPIEKDDTDTMLAIKTGLKKGYNDFLILGGMGGRLDHTLANIHCLYYIAENGATAELCDEHNKAVVIKNSGITLSKQRGKKVSVFAYGGNAQGVTEVGFYYKLNNATLTCDNPLGVSNYIVSQTAEVKVQNGALLIIISDENQ